MKKKTLLVVLTVISLPIALYEYFVLLWFWGGDGIFSLIVTPIVFALLLAIQLFIMLKCTASFVVKTVLKFSALLVTPVLTMLIVYIVSGIFGVEIIIM